MLRAWIQAQFSPGDKGIALGKIWFIVLIIYGSKVLEEGSYGWTTDLELY